VGPLPQLQTQVLLVNFLSVIVHTIVLPTLIDAVPLFPAPSIEISTYRLFEVSDIVTTQPLTDTVAVVAVATSTPLQQNRYPPVFTFTRTTFPGFESSCTHRLATVTGNVHCAVLFDASVAVHVTVVVPTGKVAPEGGLHATVTPGQLSVAAGVA
jgi:hypothetical protein